MWKNYLISSFRFLKRYKGYTLLNLLGLSIGIATSIFIFLWVLDELSYDKQHENYKNIVRLVQDQHSASGVFKVAATPAPYSLVLKEILPEVKNSFRLRPITREILVTFEEKKFYEKNITFADSSILNVLSFDFIIGDNHALDDKDNVIITESIAKKYFGNENPYGKFLKIGSRTTLKVSAVVKDFPHNSHIKLSLLASFERLGNESDFSWHNNSYYCYLLLENNVDHEQLNKKFVESLSQYMNERLNIDYVAKTEHFPILYIQPLEKVHLNSDFNIDLYSHTQPTIQYVYFFSIIGFVILIIIAINYTNLAIARYSRRTIEVGIRKVCGSFKMQLIKQFLIESIILTLISYLIGVFLVEIFIPHSNQFTDKNLSFSYSDWRIILGAIVIILFTGILSGSYPAFFLSSLSPINAIKGIEKKGSSGFRKILVIIQFSLGAILIIGTLTVYKQLDFIQELNLGLNKDHVIYTTTKGELGNKFQLLKNELENTIDVENVTHATALPTYTVHSTGAFKWETDYDEGKNFLIHREAIGHDFLETFQIKITEGRNFIKGSSEDSANYIVNETAVKLMGFENPLGEKVALYGNEGRIIGVMKDFNFKSLHKKVEPMIYYLRDNVESYIIIRLKGKDIRSEMGTVERIHNEINPVFPFDFKFIDKEYEKLYKTEQKTGELFSIFSIIAIFLACLGFLGLASFMAEQRTKEIAVRKVFGASPKQIGLKLIWSFTKWILIANIIAIPFAYYILNSWLDKFAYRISIGYQVFTLTLVFTLFIAISAQIIQVIRAIRKNPANSLKYE